MIPLIRLMVQGPSPVITPPIEWTARKLFDYFSEGVDCFSKVRLQPDGIVRTNGAGNLSSLPIIDGTWFNEGTGSDYWVERTITGGNPGTLNDLDPGTGRISAASNITYGIIETTTGQTHTCALQLDFYNAFTGGDLLATVNITLSANKQTP